MIGDWIVDLMESGVVTNVHKPIDVGVTTTGAVFGTRRLYDYVDDNPAVRLRPISYTHDPQILVQLDRLIAPGFLTTAGTTSIPTPIWTCIRPSAAASSTPV